ncbi:UMTA methyltransferase family protein [Hypoxylon fuscum]|nr:UMTA methyltransferase family protein [Hypoxylon fuscum]
MSSKPDYVFTRDFLDNSRINLMHHLWTKLFGYLIHPKIPTEKTNLRVADVGAGTGIWLHDVGDQLGKSSRLDALDISFNAAPPPETLPSNMTFRQWDVREEVPDDLVNVFDIVNLRFFSFVLLNEEVPRVVGKLFRLLKPGGYVQWGEPDFATVRVDKTRPDSKTEHTEALMKLLTVQDPRLNPSWVIELPQTFSAAGFVDIETDIQDAQPWLGFMFHECALIMHELIARKTKNEKMAQEVRRLLPLAVEETRKGAYVTAVRWTIVGKKP